MQRLIPLLLVFALGCVIYVGAARTMRHAEQANAAAINTILGDN